MRLSVNVTLDKIIKLHNLEDLIYNRHIYIEIREGIYSLLHIGKLAHDELVRHLKPYRHEPII